MLSALISITFRRNSLEERDLVQLPHGKSKGVNVNENIATLAVQGVFGI
jgi:hypothetical protein